MIILMTQYDSIFNYSNNVKIIIKPYEAILFIIRTIKPLNK